MVELAWRMGLYDQEVVMMEAFGLFLENCHKYFPNGQAGVNWWTTIANGVYIPKLYVSNPKTFQETNSILLHSCLKASQNKRQLASTHWHCCVQMMNSLLHNSYSLFSSSNYH